MRLVHCLWRVQLAYSKAALLTGWIQRFRAQGLKVFQLTDKNLAVQRFGILPFRNHG